MPNTPAPRTPEPSAVHSVKDAGDALYRAAQECCHQHERITALITVGADDKEFTAACEMADFAESQLSARTAAYEEVAAAGRGAEPEEWWHRANALWMACREYSRRYAASADATSRRRHTTAALGEIAVQYELEISARLAVKQAIKRYGAT
jgi:hypothetical protein